MIRKTLSTLFAIATILSVTVVSVDAAEITVEDNVINVSGKIVGSTGDYFSVMISEALLNTNKDNLVVSINSNGGSIDSAMDMVKVIRSTNKFIPVTVKTDNFCHSACGMVLFATTNYDIADDAVLLFHAPSLKTFGNRKIDPEVLKEEKEFYIALEMSVFRDSAPNLADFLEKYGILEGKQGDIAFSGTDLKSIIEGK